MKIIRRIFICLLVSGCLFFTIGINAKAVEFSDEAYYKRIYSSEKAKINVQYSASLSLTGQNGINARFSGYAGVESGLNNNEIKDIINKTAQKNEHYNSFDNVKEDIDRLDELKHRLDFTEEDYKQWKKNMQNILGISNLFELANAFGKINYGTFQDLTSGEFLRTFRGVENVAEVGVDFFKSGKSIKGMGIVSYKNLIPSPQQIVLNGAVVSGDQYKKDKQKFEDMAEYATIMQDFRGFYISVLSAIKKELVNNSVWVIKINDKCVQDIQYVPYVKTPTEFTCNLNLSKGEKSSRFGGVYTGSIEISSKSNSLKFDKAYGPIWENILNGTGKDEFTIPSAAADGVKIRFIGDEYTPTDFSFKMSNNNFSLTTNSFGYGKSSGLLTQNINLNELNLDGYVFDINHNVHLGWQTKDEKFDYYYTILGTNTFTSFNWDWRLVSGDKTIELHNDDFTESGNDPRPFLQCVLYIDVTDGGNYEWQLPN